MSMGYGTRGKVILSSNARISYRSADKVKEN